MSVRKAWTLLATVWAATTALAAESAQVTAPAPPGLRFEQVFSDHGEPRALHFQARFSAGGVSHNLEVWRDGQERLLRRTDDAIETHVARKPGTPFFELVVLDLRRKIETRITRDDLYRIGSFTDWFDLAHGLRYPKGGYLLTASAAPAQAPQTVEPCNWYTLVTGSRRTALCWDTGVYLPLVMIDEAGRLLWQVTSVERKPPPAAVFEVHDHGFVRANASQDIDRD